MRNLCEYTLKTNRLCKNYRFSDTYCYVHDYMNELCLVFYVLCDLFFYLILPIIVIFIVFLIINYYINSYLETIILYNDLYEISQLDDILM